MKIEFEKSNLQATIISSNCNDGLKRYKNGCEDAILYWEKQKEENFPNADQNIQFFKDALTLCKTKLQAKEQ